MNPNSFLSVCSFQDSSQTQIAVVGWCVCVCVLAINTLLNRAEEIPQGTVPSLFWGPLTRDSDKYKILRKASNHRLCFGGKKASRTGGLPTGITSSNQRFISLLGGRWMLHPVGVSWHLKLVWSEHRRRLGFCLKLCCFERIVCSAPK